MFEEENNPRRKRKRRGRGEKTERRAAYLKRRGLEEGREVIDVVPASVLRHLHRKLELLVTPRSQREFIERDFEEAFDIIQDVYDRISIALGYR